MSNKGKRAYNYIGNFTLESDSLHISDPGYEKDIWCAATVEDGKHGIWAAYVVYGDEWFNHCCDATGSDEGAGTIFCGAISSSGYGDGCYFALTHTDREGMVDAVAVIFMEV